MYDTFQAFRPHFDALTRVGYFKAVLKPETKRQKKVQDFYRAIVWIGVLTYNIQYITRAIKVRHQTDQLIAILFLTLSTLNTLGKQLTYNFRIQRIDKIIETVNSPIFAPKNTDHEALLKVNAKSMSRLLAVCHIGVLACSGLYSVGPIVEKLLGYDVVISASFPFDVTKLTPFLIANLYMGILISMQAYGHITMDCLVVAFYVCVKNQLQLLRYDLEHLMDDFKLRKKNLKYVDDDDEYRKILHSKIVACLKHYDKIVWFIREIQLIFNEAMVMQFLVATWVICITAYRIVGLPLFAPDFFSSVMYLCCILGQLFMYCYFGTLLKVESGLVNESIYRSDWLSMSPAFRRYLFILMERCKREIEPRTAFIIPMSIDTYISVLRSSYALFTILNRKE